MWTQGTDSRLVFEERRERAVNGIVVAEKRAEASWLRGIESVVSVNRLHVW